jgi:hypothetical protein
MSQLGLETPTFADIDSIKKAQEAAASATATREAKTKSDEALKLASEQGWRI